MSEKQFTAQDVIYSEGDIAIECYVVVEGTVQISTNTPKGLVPLHRLSAGAVFGESALEGADGIRRATAVAMNDVRVFVITASEYEAVMKSCEPNMQALLKGFLQLSNRAQLTSHQQLPDAVSEEDGVSKITVSGAGSLKGVFEDQSCPFGRLPFKLGGYPEGGEFNNSDHNNLYIPCRSSPLAISRQHCHVELADDGLFVLDLGSRFNTIVNGIKIGRGRGLYRAPLQKGKNTITLGDPQFDYQLIIQCD